MSDFSDYSYLTPPTDPAEFDAWLLAQEERIARKTRTALAKIIDEATEAFVNSLTATGDMSYFDSIPMQWAAYVDDVLLEDVQGLFLSGGLAAYATSPSTALLAEGVGDAWVNVVNQSAVDYALEASNRMKDVGKTAWNDIKNKVSVSIEKGTSTDQLRELLLENRRFSEYRAETIARTETANAYNNGDWAGQQALGQYGPTHKYWVSTSDNRTRTSHLEAPNQNKVIPVSQPFIVGGYEMMFPHSPGAPAKEVVNCRCRALYLYPGDIDPFTGEIIGDVPAQQVTTAVNETAIDEQAIAQDFSLNAPRLRPDQFSGKWQSIIDDSGGYSSDLSPNGDMQLVELWKRQGFTAKPKVVTSSVYDDLVDSGWTKMSRGISGETADEVDQYIAQFMTGDTPYAGKGMFGNGTYAAAGRETAENFTKQTASGSATTTGKAMDLALHPDAKIIDFEQIWPNTKRIVDETRAFRNEMFAKYDPDLQRYSFIKEKMTTAELAKLEDLDTAEYLLAEKASNWATVNGYDAIRIVKPQVRWTGSADDFVDDIYYVILNRGALAVKELE